MIEINLLPGAGKQTRGGRSAAAGLGASLSGAASSVKDPFMAGASAAVVLALLATALMFLTQRSRENSLAEAEQKAVADSTRFAKVLREKRLAEAQRDSVMRQLNVIKSIDGDRFVWPHVLDEVSRALPPYTWLTSIQQTSAPTSAAAVEAKPAPGAAPAAAAAAAAKPAADTMSAPEAMKFRLVGNTVDIQALTRFITLLEQSAFVKNVQLARSELVLVEGQEVTEFQVDAEYEMPDPSAIRTVPVTISVR